MHSFLRTDTYKISSGKDSFKVDNKVLIRLYQPIIGAIATSLYMTLESEITLNFKDRVYVTIERLLKILHITIKDFNTAIEQLYTVKLLTLRSKKNNENDFLFKLAPLKSAHEFFNDENLMARLKQQVSEIYYQQITSYFTNAIIDEDEYVDISESLKEISEEEFYKNFTSKYEILKNAINDGVLAEVRRVKRLFTLDYTQIELALFNSVSYVQEKISIDLNKFNTYIEQNFTLQEAKIEKQEDSIAKYAENLEKIKPIVFYEKNLGRTMLPSEIKMISQLQDKYSLNNGQFNAIIDYYFHYGKKTMGRADNYLDKIISTITTYGCRNALETMNYLRNVQKVFHEKKIKQNNLEKEENSIARKPVNGKIDSEKTSKKSQEEIDPNLLKEFCELLGD